jgi:catechol 2,3-dioxygenase-like lactoylglutathione lyase family enzyme
MTVSGIHCVCYIVSNMERSRAFYETHLGLKPTETHGIWCEYTLDDGASFGLVELPPDMQKPGGGVMFGVADARAMAAALTAAGVAGHGDMVVSPVCEMAWFDDPDGNGFAVHQRLV